MVKKEGYIKLLSITKDVYKRLERTNDMVNMLEFILCVKLCWKQQI